MIVTRKQNACSHEVAGAGPKEQTNTAVSTEITDQPVVYLNTSRRSSLVNQQRVSKNDNMPLKLRHVLRYHEEGPELLQRKSLSTTDQKLADNVRNLVWGNAMTKDLVGQLAQGVPAREASQIFNKCQTTINNATGHVREVEFGTSESGPFVTLQKRPGCTRKRISDIERVNLLNHFL
jgi:hypothetical protein